VLGEDTSPVRMTDLPSLGPDPQEQLLDVRAGLRPGSVYRNVQTLARRYDIVRCGRECADTRQPCVSWGTDWQSGTAFSSRPWSLQ
jgi:hypothetical protein